MVSSLALSMPLLVQVGNPCLDEFKNLKGQIDYLWSHGVISDEVLANITKNCRFSPSDGKACSDAMDAFDSGNTDPYDIYGPVCINAPDGKFFPSRIVRDTKGHLLHGVLFARVFCVCSENCFCF